MKQERLIVIDVKSADPKSRSKNGKLRDLTGRIFNFFTILHMSSSSEGGRIKWVAICKCGLIKKIRQDRIKELSCPNCKKRKAKERSKVRLSNRKRIENITYTSYYCMKKRCHNKNDISFKNYGAKGISVCERWLKSYKNFLSDMGERPSKAHTIDRIDNSKNYCKENCRWATWDQQAKNRSGVRATKKVTYNGREIYLKDFCKDNGLSYKNTYMMIYRGLSVDYAINYQLKLARK